MAGKGKPKTGGRQKGTQNVKSRTAEELCEKLDCDPLEILLLFAKGDWKALGYPDRQKIVAFSGGEDPQPIFDDVIPPALRQASAKDAAKYKYTPKKEVAVEAKVEFKLIVEDYTK